LDRSREIRNLTLSNGHLKRELTIIRRSRDEAVEKARLMRINLSIMSIENEMLRQTNDSIGKLAMSALNANQGLQTQLKLRSHPGIDVFMGRRRKEEGLYWAGTASCESAQQVHAASQGTSENEAGSDSSFRRASVESVFASGFVDNDSNIVYPKELISEKGGSENSSFNEAGNASGVNASWDGAGTSWMVGSQQSSVECGVLTEAGYKKQSEPQLDEFAWLYMEYGQDNNAGGGLTAGNL